MAGQAWKYAQHGEDSSRAVNDLTGGIEFERQLGAPYQPIYDAADRFVNVTASKAIRAAAMGVVCFMPQNGMLRRAKLDHLVRWLRARFKHTYNPNAFRD